MLTRYGFTSVFDLGSPWENTRQIRERIESGEIPGPRILSRGEVLIGKGGVLPAEAVLRVLGVMPPAVAEVSDASETATVTKGLIERGTDGLKIFSSPSRATHSATSESWPRYSTLCVPGRSSIVRSMIRGRRCRHGAPTPKPDRR